MEEIHRKKLPFAVNETAKSYNIAISSRMNAPDAKRDDEYTHREIEILDSRE
jgi:hypothetical protein